MRSSVLVIVVAVGIVGCGTNGRTPVPPLPTGTATLTFTERWIPSRNGEVYTEGAVQVVRVNRGRAASSRQLPPLRRDRKARPVRLRVTAGTYVVKSATRICAGNCGQRLGEPILPCRARIRAPASVVVVTSVHRRCRILLGNSSSAPVARSSLPDPCRNPGAFARAIKKRIRESAETISVRERQVLRLLAAEGTSAPRTCLSTSYTDAFPR
jgi:hypothetical protein